MSAWTYCLQDGKAAPKIVPPRLRIPCWKGLGADSEEKHEPASDIDTMAVDSLKAIDPKRPIREADIRQVLLTYSYYKWERRSGLAPTTIHFLVRHKTSTLLPGMWRWRC